ncbi:MAG: hypothetical protein U0031_21250 [Thermomicrobiales bacterium]
MTPKTLDRRALIAGAAATIPVAIVLAAMDAGQPVPAAEAQTAPSPSAAPDQTGGLETSAALLAATPAAPPPPPPVDPTGSMTTSLGGSDIAVSSVGGSYEVDGPARKARKASKKSSND